MRPNLFTPISAEHALCVLSSPAQVSAPATPENERGPIILDEYTIKMSDNLSGVFMPVDPSVGISALTQSKSADLSGDDDLVQVLYDWSNMSDDRVQS